VDAHVQEAARDQPEEAHQCNVHARLAKIGFKVAEKPGEINVKKNCPFQGSSSP
jgi:hypothetical protein